MPPRKRKAAAESAAPVQNLIHVEAKAMDSISERLKAIDAAVEERCEAILAAADEAATKLMHELKYRLMGMPKKVKSMTHKEYIETAEQPAETGEDAAAAAVDHKIAALQKCSEAAGTAAPTTRSLRSRARAATGGAAAVEPRTVRATCTRQRVPKFDGAAAAPTDAAATASAAQQTQEQQDQQPEASTSAADVPESSTPPAAGRGRRGRSTTAALPALSEVPADDEQQPAAAAAATTVADAKRASIVSRAQAKVDAKLASMGLAASTAARGAGRTALRAPQPGEACFSKNGSPLSIHPNVTRSRGRTAAAGWALMTPAVAAAAQGAAGPNGSMLGCFTLVNKGGGAAGAAAATGRAGRGRARTAAAAEDTGKAKAAADTAMVIMTEDGKTFTVDAAAGGLESVPATHRQEVEAKLRAIQQLAAIALKGL